MTLPPFLTASMNCAGVTVSAPAGTVPPNSVWVLKKAAVSSGGVTPEGPQAARVRVITISRGWNLNLDMVCSLGSTLRG